MSHWLVVFSLFFSPVLIIPCRTNSTEENCSQSILLLLLLLLLFFFQITNKAVMNEMIEDDEGTSSCQEFLQVPINFTHSVVGVRLDEFPSNLDLINALQGEYAPLKAWLQCAIGYYRLGQFSHFLTIMEAVTDAVEQIDVYKDSRDERVALMNVLAAYYSQLAASHPSQSEREKYRQQTNKLCNDANRLQDHDDSTSVIMSGLHL